MNNLQHLGINRILSAMFRSPQREVGYLRSYATEVEGGLSFLVWQVLRTMRPLKPISICTGLKNRSDNYIHYVLDSVCRMKHRELVELSVFDCGSDDVDDLEGAIKTKWTGPLVFKTELTSFNRSYSFNGAIRQASNPIVFAADADMSLPDDLVELANKFVSAKSVWFPICFNLYEGKPALAEPDNGRWFPVGKGMFAASKKQFTTIGSYDERFTTWGGEDWDLWKRFYQFGFLPIRSKCHGLFHHWHPRKLRRVGVEWQ